MSALLTRISPIFCMPFSFQEFVFASAVPTQPIHSIAVLFPTVKDAQAFPSSPNLLPVVFLPHTDKSEIQRSASAKIPALLEVHSMQGAFDALKLSGVKFVKVNPLQNKTTIDVAWMSVAKQKGISVVFALHDLQSALQLKKSRPVEEFQKLARLLSHYEVPYMIASFAKKETELLSQEEILSLREFLENEKLLHHIQLFFLAENEMGFMEEPIEALE